MTGAVFVVCVPTDKHEQDLRGKRKRVVIKDNRRCGNVDDKCTGSSDSLQSPPSKDEAVPVEHSPLPDNYEYVSMQKLIHDVLAWYKLEKATSTSTLDVDFVQLIFTVEDGQRCEDILSVLREHGVGLKYDSTISIIPCSLYYQGCDNEEETFTLDIENSPFRQKNSQDTAWTRFVSSMRARLTVAEIVEILKTEAALTFDFMCLLLMATIMCAIGLVENSNMYLISSMLISPMMGPVMAWTFGTVIRDRSLLRTGVQTELIGLGVATLVGFGYGTIICLCTDKYGEENWPTTEMFTRGQTRSLGVGCLIALLSGAAVAVGVLSDNIASLVGVAISTSLMPPAVNAGLLWSLATIYYIKGNETSRYIALSYTEYYSKDRFYELSALGAVSLCLTFVNIVCIYIAAILVFKIKEVAPITSRDPSRRKFWKHDIKVARDYNKSMRKEGTSRANAEQPPPEDNYNCKDEVLSKYKELHHSSEYARNFTVNARHFQYTWSPYVHSLKRPKVNELKELYTEFLKSTTERPRYRRLSQIFPGVDVKSEELVPEPSATPKSKGYGTVGRKFIVTPCNLESEKYTL